MTWIRLDDTFFTHPKTLELLDTAGTGAVAFHLAGICWCSHRLTDGRVPDSALSLISSQSHTPPSVIEALVDAGHWERHPDGRAWQITGYLDWQESRATVEAKREREREKKRKQRESPDPSPQVSPGDSPTSPAATENRGQSPELLTLAAAPADDGFEDFWTLYPPRDGKKAEKRKAATEWSRMDRTERAAAMIAVKNYADSGWKPKDAWRWLRDGVYEDWQTPATPDQEAPKEQAVY